MGLWSSFAVYKQPWTAESKKLYTYDELLALYGSVTGFCEAEESNRHSESIFSEPKHRELDHTVFESAKRSGKFLDWRITDYEEWCDVWYQITAPDLTFMWQNLLFELGQYAEDAFDDEISKDHLERYGRCWQLINHELPAMYKIQQALKQGQVVYYSTTK